MIVKIPPPLFRSHFQFYVRRNLSRSKLSFKGAIAMLWQACHYTCQDCRKRGGALAPHFLAEQLILSQPGGQIMPTTVLRPLTRIFRPCDGPACRLHEQFVFVF